MAQFPDWSHQILLPAEPLSASTAREFVTQHLAAHELMALAPDVGLVVSELATNAVAHARTPYALTVSGTGAMVLVVVQDESTAVPVRVRAAATDVSGRGLSIVEHLSHDWGTEMDPRGRKSVWAAFWA